MRFKNNSDLWQSGVGDNVWLVPLIGYSYPFEQFADAEWLANELKPSVIAMQGRLYVIAAELLIMLPEAVRPEHVGNLGLFKFEEGPQTTREAGSRLGPASGV